MFLLVIQGQVNHVSRKELAAWLDRTRAGDTRVERDCICITAGCHCNDSC